jgi:hypothetical protein
MEIKEGKKEETDEVIRGILEVEEKSVKKPKKRFNWIPIIVVVAVFLIIFGIAAYKKYGGIQEESWEGVHLFVLKGCPACEAQKESLGDVFDTLNASGQVTDCYYEQEKCLQLKAVPTWVINGKGYVGLRTLEQLRGLKENE